MSVNDRDLRAELRKEFRHVLTDRHYKFPLKTEAVIVLSGESFVDEDNKPIERAYLENWLRVIFGLDIIRKIAARNTNKEVYSLEGIDITVSGIPLVLNGETEQLPIMRKMVEITGFPSEMVKELDCGKRGEANTLTQMEAINNMYPNSATRHLTLVTSDYHVPRVVRTADANLHQNIDFKVFHAPHYGAENYPLRRFISGEVSRITRYAAKGDIVIAPQRGK